MLGRSKEELAKLPIQELRDFPYRMRPESAYQEYLRVLEILADDCRKNILPEIGITLIIGHMALRGVDTWWTPSVVASELVGDFIGRTPNQEVYDKKVAAKVGRILREADQFESRLQVGKRRSHEYRYTNPDLVEMRGKKKLSLRERVDAEERRQAALLRRMKRLGIKGDMYAAGTRIGFSLDTTDKLLDLHEKYGATE